MTYAMTLDNSWEIMSEDEMYDVNGGLSLGTWSGFLAVGYYIEVTKQEAADFAANGSLLTAALSGSGFLYAPMIIAAAAAVMLSSHFWYLSNGNVGRLYFNTLFSNFIVWKRERF